MTPTGAGSGEIMVNDVVLASGADSDPVPFTTGTPKTITVVAKETGKSVKTYVIEVTRGRRVANPEQSPFIF